MKNTLRLRARSRIAAALPVAIVLASGCVPVMHTSGGGAPPQSPGSTGVTSVSGGVGGASSQLGITAGGPIPGPGPTIRPAENPNKQQNQLKPPTQNQHLTPAVGSTPAAKTKTLNQRQMNGE